MIQINPYLNYTGNCEEAFNFYRSVFGGEFTYFSRMGEMPDMEIDEKDKNKVMHVSLPLGQNVLMGSDIPSSMDSSTVKGNNISVSVNLNDPVEARRIFQALAQGGTITMPMGETFWSPLFGMCIDKFGIPWMVGVEYVE